MAIAPSLQDIPAQFAQFLLQFKPPTWLVHELQDKLVIVLNHVLSQEPAAMERLRRQQGRQIAVAWREHHLQWRITPAGLLERATAVQGADLRVQISEPSPVNLVQGLVKGDKPAMRIEGDVMLASEINWLVDHVRWDAEEDLSRIVGDAAAHRVVTVAKRVVQALSEFVRK
jgi:ubiquinone biosynthesis protein UbiJ